MLNEVSKIPRISPQDLQVILATLADVKMLAFSIGKQLHKIQPTWEVRHEEALAV